ncbi:MAG: serine hydrolase [Rhizobiales bacterium]|nr:serine hydrolase [Hyphomicrobiales bacterium]
MIGTRGMIVLAAATAFSAVALTAARPQEAARVATGFVSHILCSATFISGLDPDQVFAETVDAMPGVALIRWGLDYKVDRTRRQVTATLFGAGTSRAVHRDGLGCLVDNGEVPREAASAVTGIERPRPVLPDIAGPRLVEPANPQLGRALDQAFSEPDQPPFRRTKAVVVMKDGQIVAERYAAGYGIDTPILGYSATKSVINALIGILVRQGRLTIGQPAPIVAWQVRGDARHAITIDQLMRHTSGLALGSSLNASLASVWDPVNRMKYMERDMAGFAAAAPLATQPGAAWTYHDGNTVLLSRVIRDAAGGNANAVRRFADQELFGPLGMRHVTLEFDATGTPEGSSQMLAPARDWARFGQLYLDDGVVGGQRILPEGWVDYSATPTPDAWVGYGAGFWTNRGDNFGAGKRIQFGMPGEAFYASGTFGQYVIIIPSQRLVIVRFGLSRDRGDIEGVARLVADVIAATGEPRDVTASMPAGRPPRPAPSNVGR